MTYQVETLTVSSDDYQKMMAHHSEIEVKINDLIMINEKHHATIARQEAKVQQMKRFLSNFCDQFEKRFDNDESAFTPEEMQEYIEAAVFMYMHFNRSSNMILRVKEAKSKLPF
jgi:predicted translin family RNA/ssDNA-binding protein